MKRVTFVLIGVVAITTFVLLSQKQIENRSIKIVKVDTNKHHKKGIYN